MGKPTDRAVLHTILMFFRAKNLFVVFVGAMLMALAVSIDGLAQGRVDWDEELLTEEYQQWRSRNNLSME